MAIDQDSEKPADEQVTNEWRPSTAHGTAEPTTSPLQSTSLMTLPAELRNAIWEYVVVFEASISPRYLRLDCTCIECGEDRRRRLMQPALTLTSRTLRQQTLPIFYGVNAFNIGFGIKLARRESMKWLQAIGPSNRKLLLDVTLWYRCDGFKMKPARRDDSIAAYYRKRGILVELSSFGRSTWMPYRGSCKVTFK